MRKLTMVLLILAGLVTGSGLAQEDRRGTESSLSAKEKATSFVLRSPEVMDGGQLPRDYTGDGTGSTLPLEWSGAPEGTGSFAVVMHHVPPEGRTKCYWVLYNIPADTRNLPRNVRGVGTLGNNSINGTTGYAPPHSKGPGPKTYVYTVYALSAPVKLDVAPSEVTRDVLLAAMRGLILASAELNVVYTREASRSHESTVLGLPRSKLSGWAGPAPTPRSGAALEEGWS